MLFRLLSFSVVLAATIAAPAISFGATPVTPCPHCKAPQSEIAQLIKKADLLYSQFKPREAAAELQRVLQLDPQNLEALAKLSRAYIDIGDSIPETQSDWVERRIREYRRAENYARRAISADPQSTWGYFYLAASLGTMAAVSSVEKQIEMAEEIRVAVEKAIALDPRNGFAYHVYGVWHRRMAEIGRMSRVFATVLYGRTLPKGSLDKSVEYLEKAVALNPGVIVSRLELARTYAAREEWLAARSLLKSIEDLPPRFSDDAKHKQKAQELLEEIKDK